LKLHFKRHKIKVSDVYSKRLSLAVLLDS